MDDGGGPQRGAGRSDPVQPRVPKSGAGMTFADAGRALVLGNAVGLIETILVPHRIHFWDKNGKLTRQFDLNGGVPSSPDGKALAATTAVRRRVPARVRRACGERNGTPEVRPRDTVRSPFYRHRLAMNMRQRCTRSFPPSSEAVNKGKRWAIRNGDGGRAFQGTTNSGVATANRARRIRIATEPAAVKTPRRSCGGPVRPRPPSKGRRRPAATARPLQAAGHDCANHTRRQIDGHSSAGRRRIGPKGSRVCGGWRRPR